jgi:hypothetical protein
MKRDRVKSTPPGLFPHLLRLQIARIKTLPYITIIPLEKIDPKVSGSINKLVIMTSMLKIIYMSNNNNNAIKESMITLIVIKETQTTLIIIITSMIFLEIIIFLIITVIILETIISLIATVIIIETIISMIEITGIMTTMTMNAIKEIMGTMIVIEIIAIIIITIEKTHLEQKCLLSDPLSVKIPSSKSYKLENTLPPKESSSQKTLIPNVQTYSPPEEIDPEKEAKYEPELARLERQSTEYQQSVAFTKVNYHIQESHPPQKKFNHRSRLQNKWNKR